MKVSIIMNTTKLVTELHRVYENRTVEPVPGAKTIYLGAGWFSDAQERTLLSVAVALLENETVADVHVPLLHQANGEPFDLNGEFNPEFKWSYETFNSDISAIENTDVTIGVLTAGNEDSGTAYELGYARALGKPRVGVFMGTEPLNLMTALGVTTSVSDPEKLRLIDFRHIMATQFEGRVM